MKDRRFPGFLALTLLVLPLLQAAQLPRPEAPAAGREPAALLDGRELPLPVAINPAGPEFGLSALVNNLGGTLAPGATAESSSLTLEGKEVVIGIGSAIITVGDAVVPLSQPVVRGEMGTLMVPVDFLRKTYGDLLGYSFDWRPETQRLVIGRRAARELPVLLDVVHLQGMTTVVLQFPEEPRYQIKRRPGIVDVQMMGDRLAPPPRHPVQDPFVQDVTITPEQVHIQVGPGLDVASYVLNNPFRIVFDVHQPTAVETPAAPLAPGGVPGGGPPGIHTIVVDPGHGGTETGAIGPSGVMEKDLTLLLARELESRLSSRLGVRVVLTRSEDATLPLDDRAAIANQNKADLFISIHLNSSLGSGAHGAETYFLSAEASDAKAAKAAAAENSPAAVPPPQGDTKEEVKDLELILWDLAQSRHLSESQRFATLIQTELNEALQLRDRGVKQAPFRVLNGAEMPAVLVELGFISNPDEEKKLQDASYRGALVDSLTKAVARYKEQVEARPAPASPAPAGTAAPVGAVPHQPAPAPTAPTPKPAPPAQTPKPSPGTRP